LSAAPHAAVAESHAAGVGAVGDHGLEKLAGLEVQQPGFLLFAVMALFLHPETVGRVHRDAIGPTWRRQEQRRGLGLAGGNFFGCVGAGTAAQLVHTCRPLGKGRGRAKTERHGGGEKPAFVHLILPWLRVARAARQRVVLARFAATLTPGPGRIKYENDFYI
jgi:hypothetical protein